MEQRRKIAVVIPKYGLTGGAEGFAAQLTERIAGRPSLEVHVFAHRWASSSERITFHRLPRLWFPRSLGPPAFAWFAGRAIATRGPFDVIHTHDRIFAAHVYTMHGIPHRWWIREVRKKRLSLYDHSLARVEDRLVYQGGCRRFLAVSELTRGIFLNEYGVNPGQVSVVHPGIDPTPFTALDRETCRREIRGRLGIPITDPLVLFVSMNFAVKGLDHVLKGLARLRQKEPGSACRLLVVGRGDEKGYGRLASELGIADAVSFVGAVPGEQLPAFYLAADLYAMLSRFDTFGMVVLEALAAGLPVLVSGRVGAKDLVKEGENGFVIEDPDNADTVADRLAKIMARTAREGMGAAARKTAQANAWETPVEQVLAAYREVWADQRFVNSKMPQP